MLVSRSPPNASDESWAFPLPDPKLLLDENLAAGLVGALADLYPESVHVTGVGLAAARDRDIWDYAAANEFILVTKDEDFHRLSILHGEPPKVVWIGLGNCSTEEVERLLRHGEIVRFVAHPEATVLALG